MDYPLLARFSWRQLSLCWRRRVWGSCLFPWNRNWGVYSLWPWTLGNPNHDGNDLLLTEVHELRHAMGQEHSSDPTAITAPFYQYMETDHSHYLMMTHRASWRSMVHLTRFLHRQDLCRQCPHTARPLPWTPGRMTGPNLPGLPLADLPILEPKPVSAMGTLTRAILHREMFVFKDQWFWRVRNNRVMARYPHANYLILAGLASKYRHNLWKQWREFCLL